MAIFSTLEAVKPQKNHEHTGRAKIREPFFKGSFIDGVIGHRVIALQSIPFNETRRQLCESKQIAVNVQHMQFQIPG